MDKKTLTKAKLEIVCSLDHGERAARGDQWRAVIDAGLRDREALPDGVRLRFTAEPAVTQQLVEIVDGERACCTWAHWALHSADDETTLEVTAPGDGAAALQALFDVA